MKKVLVVVIGIAAFAVGWFFANQISGENHSTAWVPYDSPVFSIQFPPNVHIEQETTQDKNSTTHFYNGHVLDAGWANVGITDYPAPITPLKATTITETFSGWFKPGFWSSPVTDATLSGLPAKEEAFRGTLAEGEVPVTLRVRVALSQNGLRLWTITTSFENGSKELSETDCKKFFDSLRIK